jgi:aryl-alcohol dehydrogenase-like predicted oxidoreductase
VPDAQHFAITTKTVSTGAAKLTADGVAEVEKGFHGSLARLKRPSVDALLVHNAQDLLAEDGERLWDLLQGFRRDGKVGRIGVSAYDGREIDAVTAKFPVDVVQLPVNALDQRLLLGGSLARLRAKGISVQARSAFLQGLLLMPPADVARRLPQATAAIAHWNAVCESAGTTPLVAALAFVLAQPEIDHVVIGVHSRDHLAECLMAMEMPVPLSWDAAACDDLEVVDPRRWAT